MLVTGDQQLLKHINRMALVRRICAKPGLSRADLAVELNLTKSTVSLLVRELIDEGWLTEQDILVTGNVGRRPTPLSINPKTLVLLGADVGVDKIRLVAVSLTGETLERLELKYENRSDACLSIRQLAHGFVELSKRLGRGDRQVVGLGVGLHGGVDEEAGVLRFSPNMGWRDIRVVDLLDAELKTTVLADVPVYAHNDASVAALGEYEFSDRSGANPLVYLSIDYGVGAGVIVNGRLLSGFRGFAGEVGHMTIAVGGPMCSCGRYGCAEAFIGLRALAVDENDHAELADPSLLPLIKTRLSNHDERTQKAVDTAGRHLGVLLQNIWVTFDPMSIVVGGAALDFGDAFLEPAQKMLKEYASRANLLAPKVQVSNFGEDAVAIGAAALVRYSVTQPFASSAGSFSETVPRKSEFVSLKN